MKPKRVNCRLYEIRDMFGWSTQTVAKRCRISVSTVNDIERGGDVQLTTIIKVSRGLGVRPSALWPDLGSEGTR